jgi:predicted PilT family ATPase
MTSVIEPRVNERGIMVEFVGAAGVGKSFLLANLADVLRSRGVVVNDFESVRIRRFDLFNPGTIAVVAYLMVLIKPTLLFTYAISIRKLVGYLVQRRAVATLEGIHLCCDGLFHKMRGIYKRAGGVRMEMIATTLLRYIDPPDVVIVVEASASTVHARRMQRARSSDILSKESVAIDVQLLEESIRTIEYVQEHIAPGLRMIRVSVDDTDNTETILQLADELQAISSSG